MDLAAHEKPIYLCTLQEMESLCAYLRDEGFGDDDAVVLDRERQIITVSPERSVTV